MVPNTNLPLTLPDVISERGIEFLKGGTPLENINEFANTKCPNCG
jgi:hypothetical protein